MEKYSFAANLKRERTNKGVTQHELARKIGVRQNTVSAWESAERYPTLDHIYDIANFLEIPVGALVCSLNQTNDVKNF